MARRCTGSISVEVDVADVINEIDDETLLQELRDRSLSIADVNVESEVRAAYRELLVGRWQEAKSILARLVDPKRGTLSECESAYKTALVQQQKKTNQS